MTVIDLIREDHRNLRFLVRLLGRAGTGSARSVLFARLFEGIEAHWPAEEEALSSQLRGHGAATIPAPPPATGFSSTRMILDEMRVLRPGGEVWLAKLEALKEHVDEHCRRFDEDVVPHLLAVLSPEDLFRMAAVYRGASCRYELHAIDDREPRSAEAA